MLDITIIVCPVVTPFNDDNQVDAPCFRQILDFVIAGGVDAVMIAGTTGRGLLLSPAGLSPMRDGADWIAGRVPLIVHTGAMTTAEVMELTRHAKSSGASAASGCPRISTVTAMILSSATSCPWLRSRCGFPSLSL